MPVKVTVDDRELVRLIRECERHGKTVYIVADGVEYGVYQELGTRFIAAKHFMRSAVETVRNWYTRTLDWRKIEHSPAIVDEVCRQAAFSVEGLAKKRAPYDTGALRASIHVVRGGSYEFEVTKPD